MRPPRFLPVGMLAGAGGLVLALAACRADIPEGVYRCDGDADCPHGFSCRADDSGDQYCFSGSGGNQPNEARDGGSGSGRAGGAGGSNGGSGSAGGKPGDNGGAGSKAGDGGAGSDARDGGVPPAAPTALGFSSAGERRTGPGLVLYDDGFERGGRDCSADGVLCVTGGFVP